MTTRCERSETPTRGKVRVVRTRSAFVRAQRGGKRFRERHLLLLVVAGEKGARLGLTVSRKVGNAVVRNRVRRRLREIARSQESLFCEGCDHVVVAFPQAAGAEFTTLREEMKCLLERARAWASCKRSSLP